STPTWASRTCASRARCRQGGQRNALATGAASVHTAAAAGKAPTALRAGRLHRRVVNARRWPPGAALVHTAAAAGKAPTALRAGRSIVGWSTQGVGHGRGLGAHRSGGRKGADRPTGR